MYRTIYNWLLDFKRDFVSLKTPYTLKRITVYLTDPSALPKDVFAAAYDVEDPPVSRELANPHHYSEHVPLRNKSELLCESPGRLVQLRLK